MGTSPSLDLKAGSFLDSDRCLELKTISPVDSNLPAIDALAELPSSAPATKYRLYKRRFVGLVGLIILSIVTGMPWPWFGPISNNMVAEFGFTLDEVNWLGTITSCVYLPAALAIPTICSRYGFRRCCDIGVLMMLVSAWVRYAGTAPSLSTQRSYALVLIGQFFAAIAQPIFQVLGPKYSEVWFDLKSRTTATMIIAIANPVGGALGQLLSPLVGDTRQSILVLGIISTAAAPFVFLISTAPPTPPTYAGSKPPEPLSSLFRAIIGSQTSSDAQMTIRERIDFAILTLVFGVLAACTNTFSILSAQIMQPVGYSANESGFLGACLILSGIVGAIITAPLFDRVFTYRLAFTAKIMVPIIAGAWLSFIWAVRPHNLGGLFALMAILGTCSITMLPVALELAVELTRNANASSAILWATANLFGIVLILGQGALRAGPEAHPPLNMHRALIFNGTMIMSFSSLIIFFHGRQARKERDERIFQESRQTDAQKA